MSFLEEADFEVGQSSNLNRGNPGGFNLNTGRYGAARPSSSAGASQFEVEDLEGDGLGGESSSSRARMLAQQRELQMKRRASAAQTGGMVRSSIESTASASSGANPMRRSNDGQFTPSIRQFSAPKAVKDPYAEFPVPNSPFEGQTEFTKAASLKPTRPSRAHDEDDDEDGLSKQKSRAGGRRDRDRDDVDEDPPRSRGARASKYSDEEDGPSSNSRSTGTTQRKSEANRRRDDDSVEDRGGERRTTRDARRDRNTRDDRDRDRDRDRERGDRRNRDYDDEETTGNNRNGSSRGTASRDRERDRDRDEYASDEDRYRNKREGDRSKGGNDSRDRDRDVDRDRVGTRDDRDRERDRVREKDRERNRDGDRWSGGGGGDGSSPARGQPVQATAVPAGPAASAEVTVRAVPPNLTDMRTFLTSPLPKQCGIVQCYIRRNKSGTNKLFPVYALYLKAGDRFLMASRKRANNKTSNYLISMSENDLSRDGSNYLGKLRSNFMGTEFQIFDNGMNPKDEPSEVGPGESTEVRKELGSVIYAANVLGSRGPRKMQVAVPAVDENDRAVAWRAGNNPGDDILSRMKDKNARDLAYLINKPPRWNDQVGAYVLNFSGRVTMASVKNFQLVDPEEQTAVVLQFGRVGKDEFTMDLQWPISPLQAFAITLSSFDSKIACD